MLSRRAALAASTSFLLTSPIARAEDEDVQIALLDPGSSIIAASAAEANAHNEIAPPRLVKHPPYAPSVFMEREGWVNLAVDIDVDGKVSNVKITESYPRGYFDKLMLSVAPHFQFAPATIGGAPRATRGFQFGNAFILSRDRGVKHGRVPAFRRLQDQIIARQLHDAGKTLASLKVLYDAEELNLTEIARMQDFAARLAFEKGNYVEAAECIKETIALGELLDSDVALRNAQLLRVPIYAALGKYDQAVDYYEACKRVYRELNPHVTAIADELRARGAGKGVHYDVYALKDLLRRSEERNKELRRG